LPAAFKAPDQASQKVMLRLFELLEHLLLYSKQNRALEPRAWFLFVLVAR